MIQGWLTHIEDLRYGDNFTLGTTKENYRMVDTYKLIGKNLKNGKRKAFATETLVLRIN